MKTVLVSLMAAATLPLFRPRKTRASVSILSKETNRSANISTVSSPNTSGPVSMAGFGSAPNPKYPIHKATETTC